MSVNRRSVLRTGVSALAAASGVAAVAPRSVSAGSGQDYEIDVYADDSFGNYLLRVPVVRDSSFDCDKSGEDCVPSTCEDDRITCVTSTRFSEDSDTREVITVNGDEYVEIQGSVGDDDPTTGDRFLVYNGGELIVDDTDGCTVDTDPL